MTALVIAEHDNNSIKVATRNTVTAALQCDKDVHVLVNEGHCLRCAKGHACDGIKQIDPGRVLELLPR